MLRKVQLLLIVMLNLTLVDAQLYKHLSPVNPDFLNYISSYPLTSDSVSNQENFYGYIPPFFKLPDSYINNSEDDTFSLLKSAFVTLPSVYDLRQLNEVSSVKNQGGGVYGGNCWAFACMGAIESEWMVKELGEFDLSEQNLAACHGFVWKYGEGGNEAFAMAYLTRLAGPVADSLDPYNIRKQKCVSGLPVVAYVPEVRWVYNNRSLTKRAIMDYGGVSTNIHMENQYYEPSNYTYYYGGPIDANHAIVLVGWDDNKLTAGGKGAWIAKNSFGETWGEKGFFYISYKDSKILNPIVYYPVRWNAGYVSKLYCYAELGALSFYGNYSESATGIIKYTAAVQQYIRKVGTFLGRTGSTVDIEIYSEKDGDTLKNLLNHYTSKPVLSVGYYTFDMPTLVQGDFYIKVTYYTPGFNTPIPIETPIKDKTDTSQYYADPVIEPSGKQWVIRNEGEWQSLGSDIENWNADLVINAYADYNLGPKANFEMNKYEVCPNSNIIFTDSSAGNITSYSWDFGADAIPSTATGKGPHTVSFNSNATPGIRNAKLTVTGPAGTDVISKEYKVSDNPIMLIAAPVTVVMNDTTQITALGDADSYSWFPVDDLNQSTGKQVNFASSSAGVYRLKVTGTQGTCSSTGVVEIDVKKPPVNDNMCNAIELNLGDNGPFNNDNATVQPNEPAPADTNCNAPMSWCDEGGLQNSVWFKFTGPSSGYASFDTHGFDNQIAIYNSTSCTNIKKADLIAANDDYNPDYSAALNLVPLTPGKTYWIQVDGSAGGDTGTFYIYVSEWPLGVEKNNIGEINLKVIPNPNNGIANIKYSSPYNESLSLKIYDLTGKLLYVEQIQKNNQDLSYPVNLTNLPKGIYFVNLISDKSNRTTKCVIQ